MWRVAEAYVRELTSARADEQPLLCLHGRFLSAVRFGLSTSNWERLAGLSSSGAAEKGAESLLFKTAIANSSRVS